MCLTVTVKLRDGHVCLTVTVSSDVRYSGVPNFHFQSSELRDDFPTYHEHLEPTVLPSPLRTAQHSSPVPFQTQSAQSTKFPKPNFTFLVSISTNKAQYSAILKIF